MRQRIYIHDPETGAMKPAWSENEPGRAVFTPFRDIADGDEFIARAHGELIVGESGDSAKQAAQRRYRSKKAAA